MSATGTAKFPLGMIVATPNAIRRIDPNAVAPAFERHRAGDWGDVCKEDKQLNDQALIEGTRLFSAYHDRKGEKFWIITEADRSSTCLLLPEDY